MFVYNLNGGRFRTVRYANLEEDVLNIAENGISQVMAAIKTPVRKILKEYGLHHYRKTRVQHLMKADFEKRVAFREWLLAQTERHPVFLKQRAVATFITNEIFNVYNNHI